MKTTKWIIFLLLTLTGATLFAQTEAELKADLTNWEQKFKSIAFQTEFAHTNGNATITYGWDGPTRVMIITNNRVNGRGQKIVHTIPLYQNAASVVTLSVHPSKTQTVHLNSVKQIKKEVTSYRQSNPNCPPGQEVYEPQPVVTTYPTKVEFQFLYRGAPNSLNDANDALYNLCKAALKYYMWAKDRG